MAIYVIVQYNGGFLPDILLLTQARIFVQKNSVTVGFSPTFYLWLKPLFVSGSMALLSTLVLHYPF